MTGYDVIGDVHGRAEKLGGLLRKLGYRERDGACRHSERQSVFVGDLVTFFTKTERVGRSSIRVEVDVWAHRRFGGGARVPVTEAFHAGGSVAARSCAC